MNIFSVGVFALCVVVFGALIKRSNKEYALLAAVGACVLILLSAIEQLEPAFAQIQGISVADGFPGDILPILIKTAGIAIVGQLVSRICKDAGESALSYSVELASKAAILVVSLPLFTRIFEYLEEIVRL
ncbi:stage III sporulation AC/AD family protein [Neglectibacter caecimuris]|uniref:stage III sporulation AC/AD family protein n=1 Tax=Neglectibacter caecimuris TaxID=3093658 RepID=UPI002AC8CA92|nr:stage III sporulation AC/AD family protein [Neglectibacter sp. M00184]